MVLLDRPRPGGEFAKLDFSEHACAGVDGGALSRFTARLEYHAGDEQREAGK
jgi:hypothetical protein